MEVRGLKPLGRSVNAIHPAGRGDRKSSRGACTARNALLPRGFNPRSGTFEIVIAKKEAMNIQSIMRETIRAFEDAGVRFVTVGDGANTAHGLRSTPSHLGFRLRTGRRELRTPCRVFANNPCNANDGRLPRHDPRKDGGTVSDNV